MTNIAKPNKQLLDDYFTKNYNSLLKYTTNYINKYNRKYDNIFVLSECYIHFENYNKEILCVESYVKNWIKQNIIWTNSKLNINKEKHNFELIDEILISNDEYIYNENKIEEIINDFYCTLTTYDKSLFNLYYNKNINTAKLIQEQLCISRSSAYNTLNECKTLENKFIQYINKI